jgi:hypothetical protein
MCILTAEYSVLGLRFSGLFFFISLCLKDFRELRHAAASLLACTNRKSVFRKF